MKKLPEIFALPHLECKIQKPLSAPVDESIMNEVKKATNP